MRKPPQHREYFQLKEVCDALARPAGSASPDPEQCESICREWINLIKAGAVVDNGGKPGAFTEGGEAPYFAAISSADAVPAINPQHSYISRAALDRLLRGSSLAGARRLRQE